MTTCYDEGTLREYLDSTLPASQRDGVRAHIGSCPACAARLADVRAAAERAAALLAAPAADTRAALERLRAAQSHTSDAPGAARRTRSNPMTQNSVWRRRLAVAAAIVAAVAVLALPPVQAAADQLLKIFRVQSVVFVPVNEERMRELQQLDFDKTTLFVAEPKVINDPGEPKAAASPEEATALAGFAVSDPALPEPPTSKEYSVRGRTVAQFQVNVEAARQLLQAAGVTDVSLPDTLGSEPITADAPPSVVATYRGPSYELTLVQGTSPQVTVPEGVDLEQLGTAMLRLLGTSPDQAARLSSQIDWNSTFVVPFPANMDNVRTVSVNGRDGLLVISRESGEVHSQLYWQRGERFYVLQARGALDQAQLVALASSLQ